jgi:Pyridoxamine 5'-phosphate oxidase
MTVGKTYDQLDERLWGWIADQRLFFVATAPSSPAGHVNLSPKGHADTFTILDGRTVAYLDLTGSGAETIAHLRDNGRITLMFCAFSGPPWILRLYGRGRLVVPGDDQ